MRDSSFHQGQPEEGGRSEKPAFWMWDSCTFDEGGVWASGTRHLDLDALHKPFTISANGVTVEMVVEEIANGTRWHAVDRRTWERRRGR